MDNNKNEHGLKGSPAGKENREPPGSHAREDYAGHLARVTPDADRNKALLQARYRALHDGETGRDGH